MSKSRKCGRMNGLKKTASTLQRKATIGKTEMAYMLIWGQAPKKNNRYRG